MTKKSSLVAPPLDTRMKMVDTVTTWKCPIENVCNCKRWQMHIEPLGWPSKFSQEKKNKNFIFKFFYFFKFALPIYFFNPAPQIWPLNSPYNWAGPWLRTLIIIIFSKNYSQMMCQLWIRYTILKNVSPSYEMVTHHLRTTFKKK
jgi:hypothetical protein